MSLAARLTRLRIPVTARGWHSLAGMFFALIFLFLFTTGTLSVFSREIDWLIDPAQRVEPLEAGKASLGASLDAVRAKGPDWRIMSVERRAGMFGIVPVFSAGIPWTSSSRRVKFELATKASTKGLMT